MPDSKPVVYLNGHYIPRSEATIDIEDRGSLFADGVYEVLRYYRGTALGMKAHLERLKRSLAAIRLDVGEPVETLAHRSDELLKRNGCNEAVTYWHVSRGSAPRSHPIPDTVSPTVLIIAYGAEAITTETPPLEVSATCCEDVRWHHCSIKSLMLLPAILAQDHARRSGADQAILHRGGTVTEGAAHNVFAVRDGLLWTHPANQWILAGVTRRIVIDLAKASGLEVREKPFTTTFLKEADEILLTGTTTHVAAVVRLDDMEIGHGKAGTMARKLQAGLMGHVAQTCFP